MARPALVNPASSSREQLLDEFGELGRLIQEFSPKVKRYKALEETIRSWYAESPAEQAVVAEGDMYRVLVGARTEERSFTLGAKIKIFAKLGKAKALELFTITLKAVELALGKEELDRLVSKAHTGNRKLIAVPKAPLAA